MNHRYGNVFAQRTFRRACPMAAAVVLSMAAGLSGAMAQSVPAELHGTWVPANAACDSAVSMQVTAQMLKLVNGKDSAALGGIEMAGPGYFPPGYRGIEAVLITEFNGQQPATAIFNVGEKKGTAQVDFAVLAPGKPNPQLNALNARISTLNLARRFPLNKVPLKKCGG